MTPHQPVGIERAGPFDAPRFEAAVNEMLRAAGFLPEGVHLQRTAERVRELWARRLLGGYDVDAREALGAGFADERRDMVVLRGIAVHGVCPHHLVPFRGVAHVAYLPGGRLHGFGGVARMVDALSHRLTYQEWFTRDVVDALMEHGTAAGAACRVEAEQLCLLLGEDRRGDERVVTEAFAGAFLGDDGAAVARRQQFFSSVGAGRPA